jgi:hypothetical protein
MAVPIIRLLDISGADAMIDWLLSISTASSFILSRVNKQTELLTLSEKLTSPASSRRAHTSRDKANGMRISPRNSLGQQITTSASHQITREKPWTVM